MEEIGAFERSELAIDFVKADLVCSFKEELETEAEKEVPALVRLGSIKLISKPYVAAEAEAANPWVSPALKSICSLILKLKVCFSPVEVTSWFTNPLSKGSAVALIGAFPVISDVNAAAASRSSVPPNLPASISLI